MILRFLIRLILICALLPTTNIIASSYNDSNDSEGYTLPELTITAPNEYDFTILPERDLIERPFTESPGLETSTSVVGKKEIEQMHAYSAVDALNYIPGAWTETRGRKEKNLFSLRGQRYPYPGFLIDGAWFREFTEVSYYLSAANFDRIDVLRSSSALLLGPGGITGMTNLIPRSYLENETQFDTLYGTHNTLRSNITHGEAGKNYNFGLSTGYYHTDGSSNMNAEENMSNFYGRFEYNLTEDLTFSWVNFGLYGDRELKLAKPPASVSMQTRTESFDPMYSYITVAKFHHDPGDGSVTEVLGNYGGRRFDGHSVGSSDWLEEDYEYGTTFIHSEELNEDNTLRFSGLYNRWICPTGKRFYVGRPGDIRTYSGMIADDHDFGELNMSIGYRFTQEHIKKFGGFNVEGSSTGLTSVQVNDEWGEPLHSVNLGASYELSENQSLFGNAAWGQLSPQPEMLDSNLQTPGNENRYKFDFGIRKLFDGFGQASITGFYVGQKDAALVSSNTVTVNDEPFALFENADRKNYGIEAEVQTNRFKNGLQFFGNFTAMKTKRTVSGDWQTDKEIPDVVVSGSVSYALKKYEFLVFAKHLSSYENDRFLPSGSPPAPLGDFVDLGAQITYKYDENTELFVRAENIADDEYSTVPGYPVDGSLIYAGFVRKF
ncbi:MAG: TonB-dependent receptor plug domain-containing protein [Sedimentisphaerales bacterium]|nr:TonB-dependent receptor plug domain-containing protein [Sedimentisphaerales bacterium]